MSQTEMTVSELNLLISDTIRREPRTRSLTVRGEVSGFKHHIASGHWYFILKDENAAVNCVMFRSSTLRAALRPRDGDSVVVDGYVDVYAKQGTYQLYATGLRSAGAGDLYRRFEALKRKLDAEGLFDPGRKRTLPMLPGKVAVVTSGSGAALQDILNVSGLRSPWIPIVVIPVAVQGEYAAVEIAAGIRKADMQSGADVIIVARGGGSPEDLWCFNDEVVARAVAESRVPVVSGVGHEIDTTICDLAADVRASTPSNAAEIVFPDRKELRSRIGMIGAGLKRAETEQLRQAEIRLRSSAQRLGSLNPAASLAVLQARAALMRQRLTEAVRKGCGDRETTLRLAAASLNHAAVMRTAAAANELARTGEKLKAISPLGVLGRGYAMVYSEERMLLTSAKEASAHEMMRLRFADGEVSVKRKGEA